MELNERCSVIKVVTQWEQFRTLLEGHCLVLRLGSSLTASNISMVSIVTPRTTCEWFENSRNY